jgi:PAS domain S-box-containing protein
MPAWAPFVAAVLDIVILFVLKLQVSDPTIILTPTYVALAFIALLAWLSSRSVEVALRDLRKLNQELDQRVAERTRELSAALSRERIESGRSKAILESIADGVIVFDLHGIATIVNPSSVRLLEIPYDDILGSTINDLSQSQALDARNRDILAGLLSSTGQKLNSFRIQWSKKTLSVSSAQVNDTAGGLIGTVAVFRDYTREAELEQMKSTFLAIVSHELRTPLNAILGYAEMIKEAVCGPVNEKQVRTSERIMTNSRRLLDIVSDLLDQAQMEAGKLTVQMLPFRPADLLENIHGVMDKIAADKSLVFISELDPELPESIKGDMARLQQVVVNLINNAIKFTDSGTVHVHLFHAGKKRWSMEVSDTGIGIPEEDIPNIFEAFSQVDSTATRKHGGFGLGLSIVKHLTEIMDGEVSVTSKVGSGSIFTVTLPLIPVRRKSK